MKKILVVDDESNIRSALAFALRREGFAVVTAASGEEALSVARQESPDVVLLDRMLPGMDGVEVCRQLRRDSSVAVIMVTARDSELDTVVGLEVGADDYVTKPFSMNVLLARIRAVLRRSDKDKHQPVEGAEVRYGDLVMVPDKYLAVVGEDKLDLSPKLFELLLLFVRNPGRVFSREELLLRVWDIDFAGGTRTVDVHINWLRKKLEELGTDRDFIVTVRGVGYKLVEED